MKNEKVLSNIKDEKLIKKRRDQMVKSSIALFKEKGYHRTTTREIAKLPDLVLGHFTNTFERKRISFFSPVMLSMTKYRSKWNLHLI